MSKVVMRKHPQTGVFITEKVDKLGNAYGTMRLEQDDEVVSNNYIDIQTKAAFVTLKGKVLERMKEFVQGKEDETPFPNGGKIYFTESTAPYYPTQTPKRNPNNDKVVTIAGHAIYRKYFYTRDLTVQDSPLDTVEKVLKDAELHDSAPAVEPAQPADAFEQPNVEANA